VGGGKGLYLGLAAAAVLVLGGVGGFLLLSRRSAPAPAAGTPVLQPPAAAQPAPTLAPPAPNAEAPVEEFVTIVQSSSPPPAPGASPLPVATQRPAPAGVGKTAPPAPPTLPPEVARAQQLAAQVSTLLGQAETSVTSRNFEAALGQYEEVLKLDPGNAKASAGALAAQAAIASLKKTFVAGKTVVRSGKAAKGGPAGFDTEDVNLAKAPDYSGLIEFEVSPRAVKAGDSYAVRIYLTNDGKKAFKVGGLEIFTTLNGTKSGGAVTPKDSEVEPQQKVMLQEVAAAWQEGVNSWRLEAVVKSNRGDTFKNQLSWK
jgi:hypothetical protein